ncbi:MAG: ABC transporter permease [Candidatus Rokubacteria bacterium]|nr:ABC transporter permease [Candidatus Rokubacteria bacterium]
MAIATARTTEGVPLTGARRLGGRRAVPVVFLVILLLILVLPAVFAPWLAPHDPLAGRLAHKLKPPGWLAGGSWEYPLGTDPLGRDMLSRMIFGARVSLSVSLVAIFIGGTIGTVLGLIAGYFGGWTDALIMRVVDIAFSLPTILLALVLAVVVGPSFRTVILIVALLLWARYARQVRGEVLSVRERDFVAQARIAGCSHLRIMFGHILPNVLNTLIVLGTLQVGYVILLEGTLSFLGVGIPPPTPAWGLMVATGRALIVSAWWVSFFPGLAILLTVLTLNLLGDWLRDRLDPKLRQV